METFIIEPIESKPETATGIAAVLNQLSRCTLTKAPMAEIMKGMKRNPAHIYIVRDGDWVVGVATLLLEQKLIHNGGMVGHIEDVVIDEKYRGQGVGKMLIDELINRAKFEGCYKVILDCAEDVVGFYEKSGFERAGVLMRMDL